MYKSCDMQWHKYSKTPPYDHIQNYDQPAITTTISQYKIFFNSNSTVVSSGIYDHPAIPLLRPVIKDKKRGFTVSIFMLHILNILLNSNISMYLFSSKYISIEIN